MHARRASHTPQKQANVAARPTE